jgi:hypothetical protein
VGAARHRATKPAARWLSRAAVACAIAGPVLVVLIHSIHVAGDVCQFAPPSRPGLREREVLWTLALVAVLAGMAISVGGLWRRRWSYGLALVGFTVELGVVLLVGLGLDPCGLS